MFRCLVVERASLCSDALPLSESWAILMPRRRASESLFGSLSVCVFAHTCTSTQNAQQPNQRDFSHSDWASIQSKVFVAEEAEFVFRRGSCRLAGEQGSSERRSCQFMHVCDRAMKVHVASLTEHVARSTHSLESSRTCSAISCHTIV